MLPPPPTPAVPDTLTSGGGEHDDHHYDYKHDHAFAYADADAEWDTTIALPRGNTATQWRLIDLDGTAHVLHLTNVFGRKPSPSEAPERAQLVSLSDAERVLSRTHALLEVEGDALYVTDLGSTNGTEVLDATGALLFECAPGDRTAVPSGSSLSLGGRAVTFTR